jgi:hypothetical protein
MISIQGILSDSWHCVDLLHIPARSSSFKKSFKRLFKKGVAYNVWLDHTTVMYAMYVDLLRTFIYLFLVFS